MLFLGKKLLYMCIEDIHWKVIVLNGWKNNQGNKVDSTITLKIRKRKLYKSIKDKNTNLH